MVYRHDPRDREKQAIATELLRRPGLRGPLEIPHQALIEFVAATTRPRQDLEYGRHCGSVRAVDPFLAASGEVHELPAMYEES